LQHVAFSVKMNHMVYNMLLLVWRWTTWVTTCCF
jgi:hypothetical protein